MGEEVYSANTLGATCSVPFETGCSMTESAIQLLRAKSTRVPATSLVPDDPSGGFSAGGEGVTGIPRLLVKGRFPIVPRKGHRWFRLHSAGWE